MRSSNQPDDAATPDGAWPRPTRMLRLEQQVGYVMAGVSLATSVAVGTRLHNTLLTGAGLLATAIFTLAVRRGHRVYTALAGFLAALAISTYFPIEVAMLLFSGYLMMRTSNAQGKIRRSQPRMTSTERREAAAARAAERSQRRKVGAQRSAPSKTPQANRRYTPPKPKPPKRPEPAKPARRAPASDAPRSEKNASRSDKDASR